MAREFSTQEARLLIERHRELLARIKAVHDLTSNNLSDLHDQYIELLEKGHIETHITNVLTKTRYNSYDTQIEQFFSSLVNIKSFLISNTQCHSIESDYSEINEKINNLEKATGALKWFFASNIAKGKANDAYNDLLEMVNGNYFERTQKWTKVLEDTKEPQSDAGNAIKEVYNNLDYYRAVVKTLLKDVPNEEKSVHIVKDILDKQAAFDELIDRCKSITERKKKAISDTAQRYVSKEAIRILQNVPIEEMNRYRGGMRVKALHDYGFDTMADIYSANVYQLSSIKGISPDAAYAMKRITKDFLTKSEDSVRISISVDNKTASATELIKALYAYRKIKPGEGILNAVEEKYKYQTDYSVRTLGTIGSGRTWLFNTDEQKNKAINSFDYLRTIHDGEYVQKLKELSKYYSRKNMESGDAWEDFKDNSIEYYNILEQIVPGILGSADNTYGLPEDLAREIQEESFFPDGLLCTLRPYQELGVKYTLHQEKVLIGDEMGLGKTIQAIATMVSLRNTGATHFIVVCPASVLANWCREIRRHSKLSVTRVHGSGRKFALQSWMRTGGVAVTTYETTGIFKTDSFRKYDLLVVDEAHYIKNKNARRSKNVRALCEHTNRLMFLTGTALENKVDEMISLVDILQPKIASTIKGMAFMSTAPQFREAVAPVYYRRKREDVLKELPELIESQEWCTLTAEEEEIYERTVLAKSYADARRVSWNVDDLNDSTKAKRMMEIIADAKEEGRKVLVFSFFLETIRRISLLINTNCYGPINGSVSPDKRQEIIDEFENGPDGSVLVAQIQSGGTGLNIQKASVVIICEPQLKPSVENQAISRAYRMGQTNSVLVYRLLCENTVDEKITDMLERKQAIFDAFADKSVAAEESMNIDAKSFGKIIEEEIDRINKKNGVSNTSSGDTEKSVIEKEDMQESPSDSSGSDRESVAKQRDSIDDMKEKGVAAQLEEMASSNNAGHPDAKQINDFTKERDYHKNSSEGSNNNADAQKGLNNGRSGIVQEKLDRGKSTNDDQNHAAKRDSDKEPLYDNAFLSWLEKTRNFSKDHSADIVVALHEVERYSKEQRYISQGIYNLDSHEIEELKGKLSFNGFYLVKIPGKKNQFISPLNELMRFKDVESFWIRYND